MVKHEIAHTYEIKLPVATMIRADVGMVGFSANGESFSFLMSRRDFERLGRTIAQRLAETPRTARRQAKTPRSNEK
jgi:hypothetical protein